MIRRVKIYTWLNNQGVRSDKGFIVQSINRFVIKYSENQSEINISVERGMSAGKAIVYVYDREFYKWNDGRQISEEKKQQILNNFIDAMKFQEVDVEVQ